MNFENIEVKEGFEQKYIAPGVHVVKFTTVASGAASTGTGFIELTVEDQQGLTCQTRFYFAPGKNTEISAQALYNFISATNNVDKTKAKAMIGDFADYADLAKKLSTLLVGKALAMVIKGKYVDNKDSAKDSWIKGEISGTVAAKDQSSILKHDASKVSGTFVKGTASATTTGVDVSKPVLDSWDK